MLVHQLNGSSSSHVPDLSFSTGDHKRSPPIQFRGDDQGSSSPRPVTMHPPGYYLQDSNPVPPEFYREPHTIAWREVLDGENGDSPSREPDPHHGMVNLPPGVDCYQSTDHRVYYSPASNNTWNSSSPTEIHYTDSPGYDGAPTAVYHYHPHPQGGVNSCYGDCYPINQDVV